MYSRWSVGCICVEAALLLALRWVSQKVAQPSGGQGTVEGGIVEGRGAR